MNEENGSVDIENVILQRLEGIKLKKPDMIRGAVRVELYSKFDDWPPGVRVQGEEALQIEEDALKVLDEYRYTVNDLMVKVIGEMAVASFYLSYDGSIRKRKFDIKSRVSMVLAKSESQWRIVHEHFSMLPETTPVSAPKPQENEAEASVEEKDDVEEAILQVLGDGLERHIAEITKEVSRVVGKEVAASQIVDRCNALASKGIVKRKGRFYPRYKIRSAS